MIDLEKLRARASGLPDSDGAIGPTWCTPVETLEILDYVAQLEEEVKNNEAVPDGFGTALRGEPVDGMTHPTQQGLDVAWENFPSYLIDHCEGDTVTEEGLQRALSAMIQNPQYAAQAKQGGV